MGNALRISLFHAILTLSGAIGFFGCAVGTVTVSTTGTGGSGGAGGTGGTGTGGTGTGGDTTSSSTGTTTAPCVFAEDCPSLNDPCNKAACINGKCDKLVANDGVTCDDGKQCTQSDSCIKGKCVGGSPKSCPTSNQCNVGVCDTVTDMCVEMPGNNGAPCSLGNSCILSATCLSGVCQPNQQVDCSFLNSTCGVGYCDPQVGCKSMPKNDGASCDDGQFCTIGDECVSGQCKGKPNTCVPPGDPCKIGVCNEALKTCVSMPGNEGAACEDGNLCTAGEKCASGNCLGGQPANNGQQCDDGNGCTGGTTCNNGVCGSPQSEIMACMDGDSCCPAACQGVDNDCLWYVSGVQQNVPEAQLVGWQKCFSDGYDDSFTSMSSILQQCSKGKLLMACRKVGDPMFHTLAMGPRADVLHDCGMQSSCTQESNGVGWYWSDQWSWGFVPGGQAVNRNSCDVNNQGSEDRICWHSGGGNINSGYRCGSIIAFDSSIERVVYQAD